MKRLLCLLFLLPFFAEGQISTTATVPSQTVTVTIPSGSVRAQFSSPNSLLKYDPATGVFTLGITAADTSRWNSKGVSNGAGITITSKDTSFWNKLTDILSSGNGVSLVAKADSTSITFYTILPSSNIQPKIANGGIVLDYVYDKPAVFYTTAFTPGDEVRSVYTNTVTTSITLPPVSSDKDGVITIVNMATVAITVNGASLAAKREVIYAADNGVWKRVSTTTIQ